MKNIEKAVENQQNGAFLKLFVIPNSNNKIFPAGYNEWRNTIEIKVCSPAKDNKANKEIITTISEFFNKRIFDVLIVKGKKNRTKIVLIKNISQDNIIKKLKESLNE